MTPSSVDKQALRILFSTYWSPQGWKRHHDVSLADFAYAKQAGLMFDPVSISHKQAVEWALRSRDSVTKEQVVDLFLSSLSTRRLDLRSALGSFAIARNFPAHNWSKAGSSTISCPVCGMYESLEKAEDISVLNFERFKWGGVRHTNPIYIGFDLGQAAKQPNASSTAEDTRKLAAILQVARTMPGNARLSDLARKLALILPSNLNERRTLIGILGYCGILVDQSRPAFFETFPHFYAREETPWVKDDWPYPVRWWHGSCGVVDEAIGYWFPTL